MVRIINFLKMDCAEKQRSHGVLNLPQDNMGRLLQPSSLKDREVYSKTS